MRICGLYTNAVLLSTVGNIIGVLLQLSSLTSDAWVVLKRQKCYTDCPVGGEEQREVVRAGLWGVCYTSEVGFIVKIVEDSPPYCAQFYDDVIQETWIFLAQTLTIYSLMLSGVGVVLVAYTNLVGARKCRALSLVLFMSAGAAGLLSAVLTYHSLTNDFLFPHHETPTLSLIGWPFYRALLGPIIAAVSAGFQFVVRLQRPVYLGWRVVPEQCSLGCVR
ncbi:uncharacterized protein LOC131954733 [Physella acuta]|uniref:uncharacterized protein LOC131954733 n=1 Tax=Physella acuta TaxID=109671 RepID=UPI0027DC1B59|nr:uncharacterized protein LOC131954733 [Physella acuta]